MKKIGFMYNYNAFPSGFGKHYLCFAVNCRMDSFNITISVAGQDLALTLQPEEAGTYKVIFHGMLVGEITMSDNGWDALPMDEVSPGIFPMYEHKADSAHPRIVLDAETVAKIGEAVETAE